MQYKKMIDIPIGTKARTAERAPIDGVYKVVEHVHDSKCKPTGKKGSLYQFRGQLMPRCPVCGERAVWELTEFKFEISPEQDRTAYVLKEVRGDRPDRRYPSGTKK